MNSTSENNISALRKVHEGEACSLVPLGFEHTDEIIQWRNDPRIACWFLTQHRFDKASHEAWLTRTFSINTDFNWIIKERFGSPVGMVGIYNVDWIQKRAEFGRLLIGSSRARGKGMAREATQLALNAAKMADLTEIYLDVKSKNLAAYSLYSSLGFVRESTENDLTRMIISL